MAEPSPPRFYVPADEIERGRGSGNPSSEIHGSPIAPAGGYPPTSDWEIEAAKHKEAEAAIMLAQRGGLPDDGEPVQNGPPPWANLRRG